MAGWTCCFLLIRTIYPTPPHPLFPFPFFKIAIAYDVFVYDPTIAAVDMIDHQKM
jgi:hypothetical protein